MRTGAGFDALADLASPAAQTERRYTLFPNTKILSMKRLIPTLSIILLFTACSSSDSLDEYSARPDFDQLTVFEIENLFNISTFNDGDFFASISKVAVGDDNTIFVSDPQVRKIYLFDQNGDYMEYLGGEGEGPGEFRQIGTVSLLAPDTLHVVDWQMARITFFSKKQGKWTAVKYFDRPTGAREYGSDIFFTFNSLYPHTHGYLGRFTSSFTPADTTTHSFAYYTKFDYELNPTDNQEYLMHVLSKPIVNRVPGRSVSVMPVPEEHRILYSNTTNGYKVSTWTGGNRIVISHITEDDSTGFEFPSNRVQIAEDEKKELVERRIPDPDNAMISREELRNYIPEYKGFSRQIIIDDQERIWILTRPFEDDDPEWLIYNKSGDLLAAAPHPGGTFMYIKNNRVYVSLTSIDGEPAFGVYTIHE